MSEQDKLQQFFKGKRVLITGNTGFKGTWLSLYLIHLGAEVIGSSLSSDPPGKSMFKSCGMDEHIEQHYIDVRDIEATRQLIRDSRPDIIFHMAAQALTLQAYEEPISTFEINSMGTAHLLESLRSWDQECQVIIVTSDKCYKNKEWIWGYRENDEMAGTDPYSASKSMAEIIAQCYYHSYFKKDDRIRISSCRAGNVIGGGDWSKDRIVPDCIKAWAEGNPIVIRNPEAIRPWNYVLDVLTGYLQTSLCLDQKDISGHGFNFGPDHKSEITVLELVRTLGNHWGKTAEESYSISRDTPTYHEHKYLKLSSIKAKSTLGWEQKSGIDKSLEYTAQWYKTYFSTPDRMYDCSMKQLEEYLAQ